MTGGAGSAGRGNGRGGASAGKQNGRVASGEVSPDILHLRHGLTNTGTAVAKAAQNPAAHRYVDARPRAFAGTPANSAS